MVQIAGITERNAIECHVVLPVPKAAKAHRLGLTHSGTVRILRINARLEPDDIVDAGERNDIVAQKARLNF